MVEYYTVVYRIDGDNAAHDAWWKTIHPLFMKDNIPISVSAVSKADEMTRLDCIRHVIDKGKRDFDVLEQIDEILSHPDPLAWWLENVEKAEAE